MDGIEALKNYIDSTKLFTVKEVAELAKREPATVRIWIKSGKIKSVTHVISGQHLIPQDEVKRILGL